MDVHFSPEDHGYAPLMQPVDSAELNRDGSPSSWRTLTPKGSEATGSLQVAARGECWVDVN
jgi:hypothetical protein